MEGKIKISQIEECGIGEIIYVEAVVKCIKEIDTTGKNYSHTVVCLEDRSGETTLSIWRPKETVETELKEGMMYRVHGKVQSYKNAKKINYISSTLLDNTNENRLRIDPSYSKGITEDNKKVFNYVLDKEFNDERYKRYAEIALGLGDVPKKLDEKEYRERYDRFIKAWCSIDNHDNYSGGLFNHVVGMMRIVLNLKRQYGQCLGRPETRSLMNWDGLLLLTIMHDYGKQFDYIYNEQTKKMEFNPESIVGHLVNSVIWLDRVHNEVEEDLKLSFKEIEELKYAILSHHDTGGNFELKSEFDKVFHAIDLLDACNVTLLRLE